MRNIIYFSNNAATTGNFKDLMKAGRMDIVLHVIIATFFLSHDFRKDTKLHLVFYGMPDPPKHIEIQVTDDLDISKKDVGNLIKKILYKYKPGKKTEVLPGCFIEKKSFLKVIEELQEQGKEVFILDKKGEDIRKAEIPDDSVFILGDHKGLPKKEMKRLKKTLTSVSIGPKTYFASQTVAIVNNELDRRNL
ncbi:MAG TPA: hypothetical protein ENG87_00530 [Candidatus Pacearchaeota archaeon]|nr:putative pseudouridine methyltransferase [archaeon BMS3Abin17]HDK41834.1 hypothetical protein [Candidatus Pacearchaeota archaeon]HDZ60526.1 hypothetical protein [Candidatus Pacearchaeota archaeon]